MTRSSPSAPDLHQAVRALSFPAVAEEFERHRSGYPAAAVDWLLPPGARTVRERERLLGEVAAVVAAERDGCQPAPGAGGVLIPVTAPAAPAP